MHFNFVAHCSIFSISLDISSDLIKFLAIISGLFFPHFHIIRHDFHRSHNKTNWRTIFMLIGNRVTRHIGCKVHSTLETFDTNALRNWRSNWMTYMWRQCPTYDYCYEVTRNCRSTFKLVKTNSKLWQFYGGNENP